MRLLGAPRGTRSWLTAGAVLLCSHYVTSQPTLRGANVVEVVKDSVRRELAFAPGIYAPDADQDSARIAAIVTSSITVAACSLGLVAWFTYHHSPVMRLASPWLKHLLVRVFFLNVAAILATVPHLACVTSATLFFLSAPGLFVMLGCVAIKSKLEERRASRNRARRAGGLEPRPARVSPKFMLIAVYSTDVIALAFIGAFLIWETDTLEDDNRALCVHGGEDPNIPIAVLYGMLAFVSVFGLLAAARSASVLSVGYECFGNFFVALCLFLLVALRIADYASMGGDVLAEIIVLLNTLLSALVAFTALGLVLLRKLPYVHMSELEAKEAAVVAYGLGLGAVRQFPGGDGAPARLKAGKRGSAATLFFDPVNETSFGEDDESDDGSDEESGDERRIKRSSSWVPEDGGQTVISQINLKYGHVMTEPSTAGSARGLSPRGDRSKRFFDTTPSPQSPKPDAAASEPQSPVQGSPIEIEASTRIQAIVRGAITRTKLHPVMWRQRAEAGQKSSTPAWPNLETSKDANDTRNDRSESAAHRAATRIQAIFRGRKTRAWFRHMREELKAATRIQALFRGRMSRKHVQVIRRSSSAPTPSTHGQEEEIFSSAPMFTNADGTWSAARPGSIQTQGLDELALGDQGAAAGARAGARAQHPALAAARSASPDSPGRSASFGSRLLSVRIPNVQLPRNPLRSPRSPSSHHKRNQTL
ncbi:Hypothetical Protein FCC1311_005852 [Hondaea fermentalgiana]|uniref:G-protein coupled receptors family 3 profile domain-containing protein n=1 Tax=Hondaea fermentalgiana TaxID=2315210 RepID=A0A2R5G018_9STRA|nr:Hypothetical Protein FCC1311_005852 [Hondaea fermentalgiana]|eukprot:GBG24367.1 Hypothetical Protein FCC1311_005852 [Hondaea fermentalgiana]